MNNFIPPNTDPNIYALTAVIIGAVISSDFNSYELNSIGNWLELIGQYLLTAGSQQQLLDFRSGQNTNQDFNPNDLDYLKRAIAKIYDELDKIKKGI